MVWLAACSAGLTKSIIFKPCETLQQGNYVKDVLPLVLSEGKRLIGGSFIFQQDNATPHKSNLAQTWCEGNLPDFINSNRWPANSPDLNVLDYYVWDAVGQHMRWDKVHDYRSLQEEIARGIRLVPKAGVASSIDSWSRRILKILRTKGAYIK